MKKAQLIEQILKTTNGIPYSKAFLQTESLKTLRAILKAL